MNYEEIDKLNYTELKELLIRTLKEDKNDIDKIEYLKKSIDFLQQNISAEQYRELNTFLNLYFIYKYEDEENHNITKRDLDDWATRLDDLQVPFNIQNVVAGLTFNYENKGKYLSYLLKSKGISICDLANRESLKNSDSKYNVYLLDFYGKTLEASFDSYIEAVKYQNENELNALKSGLVLQIERVELNSIDKVKNEMLSLDTPSKEEKNDKPNVRKNR